MSKQTSSMSVLQLVNHLLVTLVLACFGHAVSAAPGDILFSDDFESGFGNWTENSFDGGDASIGTETSNSPNSSMRLRWDGVSAISDAFDNSVPAARLDVWIRRGADSFSENPDNNEDLIVEYLNSSNNWIALESFDGGGTPGEIFDREYVLPADALHGSLRIRFRYLTGSGFDFDYWHVDDVVVTEIDPPPPLELGSCDEFENGLFNWTVDTSGGGDAGISDVTSSSPNNSLFTRWGTVAVTSVAIDTSAAANFDFEVWIRRGDDAFSENPEAGEDLVVEYRNDANNWIELETFAGSGTSGEIFNRSYQMPADASHADFRIRFRQTGGSGSDFDYWHVDDVCLVPPPSPVLEWRMDEDAWTGAADEVQDESGNNHNGTAQGGADTDDTNPAIPGDPGTCGYGTFDGNDDYVEVNNLSNLLNGTASLAFWIRTTQSGNDTGWQAPGVSGVEEAGGQDDIFWGWIDASGNIGVSVGNDFAADQKSTTEINDGSWHHVVLTRDAGSGDTKVYVDGVLETSGNTGTGVIGNSFSSIGRIEDTGGSPEYLDGDLDEVQIFDQVLDDNDVIAVRDSTHPCTSVPALCAADFAVHGATQLDVGDRVEVNGTEVTGSGNSIDPDTAQQVNSNPPLPNFDPPGFPSFSGPNVSIPPPSNNPVSAGDYNQIQIGNNRTADFDTSNGNDFRIQQLQTGNNVTLNLEPGRYFIDEMQLGNDTVLNVVGGGVVELFIGNQLQANDRVEFTSGGGPGELLLRMYDGGQLRFNNDVQFTGTVYAPGGNTDIELNDRVSFTGGLFSGGDVDIGNDTEFFYDQNAETAGRLVAQCGPTGPDHYAISHDGTGVTCLADEVTITAHALDHSPVDAGTVTLNLSTTIGRGDWSAVVAGTGTLNNGTAGDGAGTYIFPGSETSVTLAFNYTNIPSGNSESFFFDVTDGTATDLGDGDSEDPEMTFARTGFRFFNETDGNSIIPTQIAGKPSDVAPNAKNISLQAIRSSDEDPTVCEPAFPDGSSRTIELAAECRNPVACAGNQVSINGNAVATNNDNGAAATGSYTPLTLSFGPNAAAPLTLEYFDAGLMQLHARFNIPLEDGTPSGDFMLGSSNDYVVRPFGFDVEVAGNPAAVDANGAVFVAAGEDFDVTAMAVAWQQADDGDNDGVPDGHEPGDADAGNNANLGDNTATPNFGQESTPAQVLLSPRLDQPAGGNTGSLTGGTGLTGFSGGAATGTVQYTEVGIIEVRSEVTNYLGGGENATGMSGYIGRFIPFDFDVTQNTPEFGTACSTGYTYIGEGFTYDTAPVLTVTARALGGSTTQNYTADFFKLTQASLTTPGSNKGYSTATGTLDTAMAPAKPAVADSGNGVGTLTFSDGGGLTFVRNAPEAPFDAEISLGIDVIDEDGVVYGDGAGNNLNPARFGQPSAGNGINFSDGKEQRWGRLRLLNAAGSELLALGLPMRTEYFDGTAFVVNTDDDCSGFAVTDLVLSNNIESGQSDGDIDVSNAASCTTTGLTTASIANNPFVDGDAGLSFSAPGEGCTGYADITMPLGAQGVSYLQFDWDGDGTHAENPQGRATFGIFSGPQEFIYIREPW